MAYRLAVCPDFDPQRFTAWFGFKSWLQEELGDSVSLGTYSSYENYREAIESQDIELVYANPYDAAMLLRDKDFQALVHPAATKDEGVILVRDNYAAQAVEDLKRPLKVAAADGPEVEMICKIMLEPAEIQSSDLEILRQVSFVSVVQKLMNGEVDLAFGQVSRFNTLSPVLRQQLRILVKSDTQTIQHMLLLSPALTGEKDLIRDKLTGLHQTMKGRELLAKLGFKGFDATDTEAAELMIDIMATLSD